MRRNKREASNRDGAQAGRRPKSKRCHAENNTYRPRADHAGSAGAAEGAHGSDAAVAGAVVVIACSRDGAGRESLEC